MGEIWGALDGWKTIIAYPLTQVLSDQNVISAFHDFGHAAVIAVSTSNPTVLVQPGLVMLGQALLAVGVAHKAFKEITK